MNFTKMTGTGNDYIFINCFEEKVEKPDKIAIKLSNRNFGIGSDGLVLIEKSKNADAFMRMYNADGSEGAMCGNAIRCVAKYLFDNKIINEKNISIETISGIKNIDLQISDEKVDSVSVNMGKISFSTQKINMNVKIEEFFEQKLKVIDDEYEVSCASIGNPHMVVILNEIDSLDLASNGKYFEKHQVFNDRVNTEFIKIIDEKTISMRVYERGSGETLACGTGACAAVAVCVRKGIFNFNEFITVNVLGGKLYVKVLENYEVILKGSATTVFTGKVEGV